MVLSFDRFSRDDVVGEAFFQLASVEIPKNDNQQLEISMDIQPRNMKVCTWKNFFLFSDAADFV